MCFTHESDCKLSAMTVSCHKHEMRSILSFMLEFAADASHCCWKFQIWCKIQLWWQFPSYEIWNTLKLFVGRTLIIWQDYSLFVHKVMANHWWKR